MAGPSITTGNCGLMPLPRNALNLHNGGQTGKDCRQQRQPETTNPAQWPGLGVCRARAGDAGLAGGSRPSHPGSQNISPPMGQDVAHRAPADSTRDVVQLGGNAPIAQAQLMQRPNQFDVGIRQLGAVMRFTHPATKF